MSGQSHLADMLKDAKEELAGQTRALGQCLGVSADLRELANHLRHCRECGETDVLNCTDGKPRWLKCFPDDAATDFRSFDTQGEDGAYDAGAGS
jgi:hypothetical protein